MCAPDRYTELDDHFIAEWVVYGLAEIGAYLAKWAAFSAYLAREEEEVA